MKSIRLGSGRQKNNFFLIKGQSFRQGICSSYHIIRHRMQHSAPQNGPRQENETMFAKLTGFIPKCLEVEPKKRVTPQSPGGPPNLRSFVLPETGRKREILEDSVRTCRLRPRIPASPI